MQTYLKDLKWGRFNLIQGDMISNIAAHYGEWSEVEVAVFHTLLNADDNVIEVGSNIGLHAVPIAKKIPQGKLLCFEPQRIIFQQLCCNLALNNLTNVDSYRLGVGEQNETLAIERSNYDTAWNYGSFSLDKGFSTEGSFNGSVEKERLDVVNLDDFPAVAELDRLALLKIDAEGFDIKVLNGAEKTIKRLQPAIFIEVKFNTAGEILQKLQALQYRVFWVASRRYQQNNFYRAPQVESGVDFNFLALPAALVDIIASQRLFSLISRLMEIKSAEDLSQNISLLELL